VLDTGTLATHHTEYTVGDDVVLVEETLVPIFDDSDACSMNLYTVHERRS
jgi:hypothetical protein